MQPLVFATYSLKLFAKICVLLIVACLSCSLPCQILGLQANDSHLNLIHFSFNDWLFSIAFPVPGLLKNLHYLQMDILIAGSLTNSVQKTLTPYHRLNLWYHSNSGFCTWDAYFHSLKCLCYWSTDLGTWAMQF